MIDPLVVVYAHNSGRVYKAIPFSSGDAYVLAVAASNPRSDSAQELTTVEGALAFEAEAKACKVSAIDYSDSTDYEDSLIADAQKALGWS